MQMCVCQMMTHAAMAQSYRDDNMTDKTEDHDINAETFLYERLLELANQMGERLVTDYDADLRLKALDRALNYQEICAKNNLGTDDTAEMAQIFLAFLKGE